MQKKRRTTRVSSQRKRTIGQVKTGSDKKKRRKLVWAAAVIIVVFLLLGIGNVSAWVWLFIAVPVWCGMYKGRKKEKEAASAEPEIAPKKAGEITELDRQKEERLANCIYDLVVIDFETTGLNSSFLVGRMDEVLSVAIIDQDGNTLLSTLCSTSDRKTWKKSEEIHGITPAMVKGKPTFSEILPQVKEILYKSKKVIAYNIPFEMGFLWSYDAMNDFPNGTKIREMVDWGEDPMLMFAAYKGEPSKYGDFKWHKLTDAAKHFKYSFKEHDALEDVKATLHVYNAMLKYISAYDDKEYILKYGKSYKKPDS